MKQALPFDQLSDELYQSLRKAEAISPVSERFPQMTLVDAYQLQLSVLARRVDAD